MDSGDTCTCGGTRLRMGGWMGPTEQRPYPDPCPECWPQATKRDVQVRVMELVADGNAYLASKYKPEGGLARGSEDMMSARTAWCSEYGHTWIDGDDKCIRCGEVHPPVEAKRSMYDHLIGTKAPPDPPEAKWDWLR